MNEHKISTGEVSDPLSSSIVLEQKAALMAFRVRDLMRWTRALFEESEDLEDAIESLGEEAEEELEKLNGVYKELWDELKAVKELCKELKEKMFKR